MVSPTPCAYGSLQRCCQARTGLSGAPPAVLADLPSWQGAARNPRALRYPVDPPGWRGAKPARTRTDPRAGSATPDSLPPGARSKGMTPEVSTAAATTDCALLSACAAQHTRWELKFSPGVHQRSPRSPCLQTHAFTFRLSSCPYQSASNRSPGACCPSRPWELPDLRGGHLTGDSHNLTGI